MKQRKDLMASHLGLDESVMALNVCDNGQGSEVISTPFQVSLEYGTVGGDESNP